MTPRRYARLSAILDRRQPDLTVLLDDLQKAHNVSAVLRTCDAVGVPRVHAISEVEAFRAKATSAAGSQHFVDVEAHASAADALTSLRNDGFAIWAAHLDEAAIDFRAVDYTRPTCIVLGQEGPGPVAELIAGADGTITIPMFGAVESLNVSVANAVLLYEAQRQRVAAGLYDRPRVPAAERQRLLFEWGYRDLARWCREKGYPYPRVGPDGGLLDELPRG
ncbi:MAG: tRNA (guanosine(18)-2'-O)-methyltransferase TrmH [Acidobacteriota bacterium]